MIEGPEGGRSITVTQSSGGGSTINIVGTGIGDNPWLNDFVGRTYFGYIAANIARACSIEGGLPIQIH